jgi:hypothetical protein
MNWAIQRYWYTLIDIKITIYGGERVPHRLLSAPSAVLANVFTSLPRSQFTVNTSKVSTILYPLLQRLGSLQRLYNPPQVTIGGTRTI